jgi:hypothetical protein
MEDMDWEYFMGIESGKINWNIVSPFYVEVI